MGGGFDRRHKKMRMDRGGDGRVDGDPNLLCPVDP